MDDKLVLSVGLTVVLILLTALRRRSSRVPPPPGPPGIPILGNILPKDQPWEAMRQYAMQYGEHGLSSFFWPSSVTVSVV